MEHANVYFSKAKELQAKGQLEEAVEAYRQVININPKFSWWHYNLGKSLFKLGRLYEAALAHHRALELNPNSAWFHHDLAEVFAKQGKLEEAARLYSKAIEIEPDFYLFHNSLGQVLAQQEKVDDAIFRYRQAVELRPQSALAYYNLGKILKEQSKFSEASVEYSKAVEFEPNFQYYHDLGFVLLILRKLDEAVVAFGNCINLNPDFFWGYHHLGNTLREQNKLDLAVIAYRRAIQIQPKFFKSHLNLGNVLEKQNKLEEATIAYSKVIELKPGDSSTSKKLIKILEKTDGKLENLIGLSRQILQNQPQSYQIYCSLGNALEKQGKLEDAIDVYSQAIKIDPASHAAYVSLGLVFEKNGRLDEAIAQYQKSFQIQPSTIDNYIHNHKLTTQQIAKTDREREANNGTTPRVRRIVAVSKPNMLINALAVLRFQEATGEYQEYDDYLVILAEFNSRNHADITLQIAQTWSFKQIFSIQRIAHILKKQGISFPTAGELIRKELNLPDIDVLYVVGNWTLTDRLILEAYPNARKIAFGDSLGQLGINDKHIQLDDAYLTVPYEMSGNSFSKSQLTLVDPQFYKDSVYKSAKNIKGLAEYCQKIQEQLGNSITIYLTKYYSQIGWISLENEIQMYVDLILSYTQPGEGVLVKGHPTQGKEQSKLVAAKLNEHDRKALDMNDDFFNKIPVELLGVFLKIDKAMGLSTSCISLAYLYKSDIVLGWGDKIKQYFQESAQHRNLVLERSYYLQVQQAYKEKFEPLKFSDVAQNFDLFPNFPVHFNYKNVMESTEEIVRLEKS